MPMEAAVVMAAARWAALTVGSREAEALQSRRGGHPRRRSTYGETRRSRTHYQADLIRAPRCPPSPVRGYSVLRCLSSAAVTSLTALIRMATARRSPGTRARGTQHLAALPLAGPDWEMLPRPGSIDAAYMGVLSAVNAAATSVEIS